MTIITFLYFLVGLGLLIFIHELGHFLVAKWAGIRVEQFSLGFGPKLFGFKRGETEYKISILPLGGYVKMSGEEPEEEKIKPLDDPRSFAAQPLWKRVLVVLAGPTMNLFLALLLMPLVFMVGHQEPSYLHQESVLIGVKKDSPADKIGMMKGDKIIEIEGKPIQHWLEVMKTVKKNPNGSLELKVLRGSEIKSFQVKLDADKDNLVGIFGIEPPLFIVFPPIIAEVAPNSPALRAGLEANDRILSVNGTPINSWDEMSDLLTASQGKNTQLEVLRNAEKKNLAIAPTYDSDNKKWILGVVKKIPEGSYIQVKYSFAEALENGIEEYNGLLGLTFKVLKKLFSFKLSYRALGGPVQIAQATAQAAKSGFGDFLYFISYLSIQLGVMNLLPIPVLDGGHLFFMLFEVARGKALSIKTRMIAMQVGMALLFSLMILVTINDLSNLQVVHKLINFVVGKF
ncbi:MAG: RIP metalloprotease RseP [Deltaproteobacteria bacterium]|nr:RIP metalloprotease RseP [Deltaproteobacteria bacterium]